MSRQGTDSVLSGGMSATVVRTPSSVATPSTAASSPLSAAVYGTERPIPARQVSHDVLSYYFSGIDSDAQGLSRTPSGKSMGSMRAQHASQTEREEEDNERTPKARRQVTADKYLAAGVGASPTKSSANGNGSSSGLGEEVKIHRRRSSKTANAADKRRLAIVEVDATPAAAVQHEEASVAGTTAQPSLLARRGMDTSRLALVAPPDASPLAYTDLAPAPPVSAPPVPAVRPNPRAAEVVGTHTRSKSNMENALSTPGGRRSASSRDIGIVGAVRSPVRTPTRDEHKLGDTLGVPSVQELEVGIPHSALGESTAVAPIFQTPTTRTSSPDVSSSAASSTDRIAHPNWGQQLAAGTKAGQPGQVGMSTPQIGESKELSAAVAPPVVTLLPGSSPHLTPGAFPTAFSTPSSASSNASDYSLPPAGHGAAYYAHAHPGVMSPPQQAYYRLQGTHINYDPVLHATAGPLPEPPRMTNLVSLAPPPPRPPRVSRSRSPLKDAAAASKQNSSQPQPAPIPEQDPSPGGSENTPKAPQGFIPSLPTPLVRSMSDHSITAVSASSESDYGPMSPTPSTPPTSEPQVPGAKARRTPSLERGERYAREGMSVHPPSAFKRSNSRSSHTASRSSDKPGPPKSEQGSSPGQQEVPSAQPVSRIATPPPRSEEEAELEEMLARMAPVLIGNFQPTNSPEPKAKMLESLPKTSMSDAELEPAVVPVPVPVPEPDHAPQRVLEPQPQSYLEVGPVHKAESGSEVFESADETIVHQPIEKSSPPLPALPLEAIEQVIDVTTEPEQMSETAVISLNQSQPDLTRRPQAVSPVKSVDTVDSGSSYESYVHAERPSTPITDTTVSPGRHSRKPSITLPFTPKGPKGSNGTRSGAERSPSLSSQFSRIAGSARHRPPDLPLRSPWSSSKPNLVQKAKAIAAWPAAMRFDDVIRMKTPLERANGYARKINELAQVESGLTNWIIAIKNGASTPDGSYRRKSPLSGNSFTVGGSRKVSAGSHVSDASFPTRPDATIATEISSVENDSPPRIIPTNLPYPSLAQGIGQRSQSVRSYTPALSINTTPSRSPPSGPLSGKKGTGFFSSIGRKGSQRRDRHLPLPNSNPLSRQGTMPLSVGVGSGSESPTRLVRSTAVPSVPGGPREPPGRLHKANPVSRRSSLDSPPMVPSAPLPAGSLDKRRSVGHSSVGQYGRPLEAPRGARTYGSLDQTSPRFSASLQNMADILPQANRTMLARYLTEANGEEMLAITRYIEDEKRGSVPY